MPKSACIVYGAPVKGHGRYHWSLDEHEAQVTALLSELAEMPKVDDRGLDKLFRRHPRKGGGLFSKNELIKGVRALAGKHGWSEDALIEKLRMKPVRTHSGVAPVTVLTKPFPCPGKCIFCPNDVRMPKSYLAMEPGAQRAAQHRFDPYAQAMARLLAFFGNGHRVDKIELIILGGTWSFYPEPYQIWFIKRCFDAMNDFDRTRQAFPTPDPRNVDFQALETDLDGRDLSTGYNLVVRRFLEKTQGTFETSWESATWSELEEAHRINETALARCVGLVVETRPDHLDEAEVTRIRRLGATKVQIGYQSLSDEILAANQRGHDVAATRRAMRLLRSAGFKIHAHWMPNLLGATLASDAAEYGRLFSEPDFRPDELKIYPCMLIESAELMQHYESGAWTPYTEEELVELIGQCMGETPPYCRLTRIIRDIPGHDIVAGSRTSNLREVAERVHDANGGQRNDIRSREIRRTEIDVASLRLDVVAYETSVSQERFLQLVTADDRIVGFLRLSLPTSKDAFLTEIVGSALIREVHVYGRTAGLGTGSAGNAQHHGLGRRLMAEAANLAAAAGFERLSVISAIGTRVYYRSLGFEDGPLYQHRRFEKPNE